MAGPPLCCMYCGILFGLKEEGHSAICNDMDEIGRHFAK